MSSIREFLVILSFLAITYARNDVHLAIKQIKPFNQQDLQEIPWNNFIGFEQDWNKLEHPLSASANTEINNFFTNLNEAYDNFGRSVNHIVKTCKTVKTLLPVFGKHDKLNEYVEQLALQKKSFDQATNSLRIVKTKMEAAAVDLKSIDIVAEKKYNSQNFNKGPPPQEESGSLWGIFSTKGGSSSNSPKPARKSSPNFDTFEKRFNQVKRGVNSAVHTIRDIIEREDNNSESIDNNEDKEPTVAQIQTFDEECSQFLIWNDQKHRD